jgi:uncharacterized protein (TIGR02996 family)
MPPYLATSPQILALLQAAKEAPEDDTPRLVLADWLEEYGDADRAEFIRLQLRLAPGQPNADDACRERAQQLLNRHGGAWLGPLWRWWLSPVAWHRGLLAVKLSRHADAAEISDVLPWLDTALFEVTGRRAFQRAAHLLGVATVNHLCLDFRPRLGEAALLEVLAQVPGSPALRTLSVRWPFGLLRRPAGPDEPATPAIDLAFLEGLAGLPLARHLSHFGSTPALSPGQADTLRRHGIEPIHATERLWMHALPAASFRKP